MSNKNLIITLNVNDNRIHFSGDTYSYREEIKSCEGSKWQFDTKTWSISNKQNSFKLLKTKFPLATFLNFSEESILSSVAYPLSETVEPEDSLSVSSLIFSIDAVIRKFFSGEQKVFGILKTVKNFRGTRIYFDLHDPEKNDVLIKCVIWENYINDILKLEEQGFKIQDDMPVLLSGTLAVNSKNGTVSLQVKRFYPEYTKGKIAAEREKTNKKLKEEGLFLLNKEKKIPLIPRNLGILTSKTGTVINDFLSSLSDSKFGFNVNWLPIRVQGTDAKFDIIKGIEFFNKDPKVDLILLFRGGGSSSDLSVFNNYEVAKAICLSSKPIYSAIGHEEDQSSSQDVSARSFGVPKDIGHYLSSLILEFREKISIVSEKIHQSSFNLFNEFENKTYNLISLIGSISKFTVSRLEEKIKSVSMLSNLGYFLVKKIEKDLQISLTSNLKLSELVHKNFQQNIERFEQFFKAISPEVQLARGYAILKINDKIITSGNTVQEGSEVTISLKDSDLNALIKKIIFKDIKIEK